MKKIFFIYFFLITISFFGQTIVTNNATVFLKNNTVLQGEMRMGLKGLRIKHNSKKFKVYMGKEIDSVHISTINHTHRFVYTPLKFNKGKHKDYKLMQPVFEGDKITLYNYNESVFMSNGFGMYGMSGGSFNFLYAIRNNEKVPVRIASSFGFHKGFRKVAPKYFKDCPKLVSKINNDIYTKENVLEAIKFYESNCNN
ncbi:hypothetical protein [Thalassobellus citreus]|uniref:hypothetical protein n=1 Tax=Thalassobellus citreus TaxID=3367752 RepID=UPI0037B4CB11